MYTEEHLELTEICSIIYTEFTHNAFNVLITTVFILESEFINLLLLLALVLPRC